MHTRIRMLYSYLYLYVPRTYSTQVRLLLDTCLRRRPTGLDGQKYRLFARTDISHRDVCRKMMCRQLLTAVIGV